MAGLRIANSRQSAMGSASVVPMMHVSSKAALMTRLNQCKNERHAHTQYIPQQGGRGRPIAIMSSSQALAYDGGTRRRVIVLGCAAASVLTFLLRRYRGSSGSGAGGGRGGKGQQQAAFRSTSERTFRRSVGGSFVCMCVCGWVGVWWGWSL